MKLFIFLLLILGAPLAEAALKVVTSTTDLAWAVKQIGGDLVEVQPLLRGMENPHYVDTLPNFVKQVSDASVVCTIGLDLEVGWMPKVLARSGNAKVQQGGLGFCETGKQVAVLDKATGPVDRSMGDVHPSGNPHFWLSPKHFLEASREILRSLSQSDPMHASEYEASFEKFSASMNAFSRKQKAKFDLAFSKGKPPTVLEYHKEFTYLLDSYGVQSMGSLEEKPGVAPSAGRIAEVAMSAKQKSARVLLAAEYSPKHTIEKFHEISGIPVLVIPTSMPVKNLDYYAFQSQLLDRLLQALVPGGNAE